MTRKRLVLVGAGHAHLVALGGLARRPDPLLDVVLVSPTPDHLYSGMVPGCIAGHYPRGALAVSGQALVERAGGRFVEGHVHALDLPRNRVLVTGRGEVDWDILSLDVGAQSDLGTGPGAGTAIPSRPVARLLDAVETGRLTDATRQNPVLVVGGGPAGVEIALALHHRLGKGGGTSPVSLATGRAGLLPGSPVSARRRIEAILAARAVPVSAGRDVVRLRRDRAELEDGTSLPASAVIVAAGLRPHAWLRDSGLPVDSSGFTLVDTTLRVAGRNDVFCVGDAASLLASPLAKAGVHAVRQGEMLAGQFRSAVRGLPLGVYRPQPDMLVLIATGPRHAIACRNGLCLSGRWAWWWKDFIDRRFVASLRPP